MHEWIDRRGGIKVSGAISRRLEKEKVPGVFSNSLKWPLQAHSSIPVSAPIRYNADVFWVTESIGAEHIADALMVFSRDRQFRTQPIVEVIP